LCEPTTHTGSAIRYPIISPSPREREARSRFVDDRRIERHIENCIGKTGPVGIDGKCAGYELVLSSQSSIQFGLNVQITACYFDLKCFRKITPAGQRPENGCMPNAWNIGNCRALSSLIGHNFECSVVARPAGSVNGCNRSCQQRERKY